MSALAYLSKLSQTGHLYVRSSMDAPSNAAGGSLTSDGNRTPQLVHLRKSWCSGLTILQRYSRHQPTHITAHMRSKIRRSFRSCAEAPDVPRSRPLCHPPDNLVGIRRVRRLDHLEVIQNDIHELSSPYRLVRAGCRSWTLHQRFPVDPDLDWRSHRSASPPRITRPVYKPDHHAWNTLRSLTRT